MRALGAGTIARLAAGMVVASLLAACETAAPIPEYPEITFTNLPRIKLDVARIEVRMDYKAPLKAPNVEHEFPVTPAAVAERWAADRLEAVGSTGLARVIVKDASVVEVKLERTKGLKGVFTKDQSERYDGKIEMVIEIRSERGYRDAFAAAKATRSRSVPEDISLNDREKVWFEMTEAMIKDINAEFERTIPQYLSKWLR